MSDIKTIQQKTPILTLRDVVVFPHMVIPLFVGRDKSIQALELAMSQPDKNIILVAQKSATVDEPAIDELYDVGTMGAILQLLKLPDGTIKVLVEGGDRVKLTGVEHAADEQCFVANTEVLTPEEDATDIEPLLNTLHDQFERYVKLSKKIPTDVLTSIQCLSEPGRLADTIAAHLPLSVSDRQDLLACIEIQARMNALLVLLEKEMDLLQVESKIRNNVKDQMAKSQREYYLHEQMKAIQTELGQEAEETDELFDKIEAAKMPTEVKEAALSELNKLKMMAPMSAEATVSRHYLDWLCKVPWFKCSKAAVSLPKAQKILDADHYGLETVKERIVEYLAVQKRVKKLKGPVLCFVGPPGVGKTSLGESIAKACGREFVRIPLGGVKDEAEIRGHRRTYIGAMPGKIIQKIVKSGVKNPLVLLDEVDKIASDFRGDPAAALLEVLDPSQNHAFGDHYLEVDYDLSDVMFVATANSFDIPAPLLDRMEVIQLSGYTEPEKMNIAKVHLLPKQKRYHGLKSKELTVSDEAILETVRLYTYEAGVRNLEREMAKLARKTVTHLLTSKDKSISMDKANLEQWLGVPKFRYSQAEKDNQIGQVNGLAYTSAGGDLLTIEAAMVPGEGKIIVTGQLGDVMQESVKAAHTVVRAHAQNLGIEPEYFKKFDLHVHVPEGATPKDGPSAGITMTCAVISALTQTPVRADVAMTGEVTLRGEVLPIGGLKEKLLAAKRAGIKTVLIPEDNQRDLKDIPENVLEGLSVCPVRWIEQVFEKTFERPLSAPMSSMSASITPAPTVSQQPQ